MSERVRIQIGDVQVEYEGDAFTQKIADELIKRVGELANVCGTAPARRLTQERSGTNGEVHGGTLTGTTATIAGKLKVSSGNDLIMAAAARLSLVTGKSEFSRQELLDEVRGASGYYRESYGKNFSNYLQSRVRAGELVESRRGYYALSAKRREEFELQLAS